jgi:hypothetical protein
MGGMGDLCRTDRKGTPTELDQRSPGHDDASRTERARQVGEEVDRWRQAERLCRPSYPPDEIAALEKTIRFPSEGSPEHRMA